jgi:ADP-heptose:LPS heptosyltransferase
VLCSPVVRVIKKQWKGDVEIHFLTKKTFSSLLENNPYLSKVWAIDHSVSEISQELKSEKFDLVIDLHRNLRSSLLLLLLFRPFVRFNKLNFKKWFYVRFGINLMPELHIVDRYLNTVSKYGIENDKLGLDYFYSEEFNAAAIEQKLPQHYVVFALGGAHQGKRMKTHQWIQAGKDCSIPVVLIGGKADLPESIQINDALGLTCLNFCGKVSIDGSAFIIEKADAILSGDTGMMHIAAAFKKKIISVWGCTVPQFGMSPYLPHKSSIILEPLEHQKRPCSKLGNRCKYGMENRCITGISAIALSKALDQILKAE